ncbi:MAG: ArsR/SmtB family transcription factor [Candidatus Helarchaeota archaeon]
MLLEKNEEEKFQIEDIFSSKGRVKIIKLLAKENELNISEIIKRTNLNHNITSKHLKILTEANILQEKIYGRIKIYRFRIEDFKVKAIKNLIDIWEDY